MKRFSRREAEKLAKAHNIEVEELTDILGSSYSYYEGGHSGAKK